MEDARFVTCPYCFESVEVWFEPDVEGSLVQDCEVCCNPWQITIQRDAEGDIVLLDVQRAQ